MATAAGQQIPGRSRVPFFGRYLKLQIALSIVTVGIWLLVPLTVWLWSAGAHAAAPGSPARCLRSSSS